MRILEPDPIKMIWEAFESGQTPEQVREMLVGRSFYVRSRPLMRPEEVQQVHAEIRAGTPIAEVHRRYKLSRSHLYSIRRKLKLG